MQSETVKRHHASLLRQQCQERQAKSMQTRVWVKREPSYPCIGRNTSERNAIMMEILQTFLKKIKNRANKQQKQGISSVCLRDIITHPHTAVYMESE